MIAETVRRLFDYKVAYRIVYSGEITSANVIWSGGHWKKRSDTKKKFERIFTILLLEAKLKPLKEFSLVISYNTKHDVDNISTIAKIFVDTMKNKYIPNDDSRYYKSTHTVFNKELKKGTVEFNILGND